MACLSVVQVLTLAHQLDPNILRRGVSAGLWDDLRHLLDMLPHAEGEGDPRLGMITSQRGPSILATDAAVTAVEVKSCPSYLKSLPPRLTHTCLFPCPSALETEITKPEAHHCHHVNRSTSCPSPPPCVHWVRPRVGLG